MNNEKLAHYIARNETTLATLLQATPIPAPRIKEAIHYALFPGGKRLRPILVYLCGELVKTNPKALDIIAAAIELTHCYSLVHDDLPAMDNDDFRRGKYSCHRAFDEATAILVGDGMQALAIDILLGQLPQYLPLSQVLAVTHELIRASGPSGMVSGQSLDLSELSLGNVTEEQLKTIHSLKTGKLILACINTVLFSSEETHPSTTESLQTYAMHLGIAFQMQDDYLDKYAAEALLGKGRASDTANQKQTFANLYSQTELYQLLISQFDRAKKALMAIPSNGTDLLSFTDFLKNRAAIPEPESMS